MEAGVGHLRERLANRARKLISPSSLHAAASARAWRLLHGSCEPAGQDPRVAQGAPTVHWPTRYEWRNAGTWVQPVRQGLSGFTRVESRRLAQPYKGLVLFEVAYPGMEPVSVALDYYDYTFVNEECLAQVGAYFKMQYLSGGYGDERVVPGGYVASDSSMYDCYCRLRALAQRGPRVDVYGRFGTLFGAELRRSAVERLRADERFSYGGGTSLVSHMRSMREAARASVCVDLPGNGPLCHRLIDYLAIGACIVAPRHPAILHSRLREGENIAYCREDLSDLEDVCARYAADAQARERISAGAARFFDEHLTRPRLAAYYLTTLERLVAPRRPLAQPAPGRAIGAAQGRAA
jgi:hypothetical protein